MRTNWILKSGLQDIPYTSFPFAFRSAFNIVRKGLEGGKKTLAELTAPLSIVGPANMKGERRTYTYSTAEKMARDEGLLTPDGQINSREFKKR